jgi:hypothetical protein
MSTKKFNYYDLYHNFKPFFHFKQMYFILIFTYNKS